MSFKRQAEIEQRKFLAELIDQGVQEVVCPASARRIRISDEPEEDEDDENKDSAQMTAEEQQYVRRCRVSCAPLTLRVSRRYHKAASTDFLCAYVPGEGRWFIFDGATIRQFINFSDVHEAAAHKKKRQARHAVCSGNGTGTPSYILPM